ncbi:MULTISPECIES: Rha family transcriptional regulator [unclassified Gilliamella]|uniref:Rha family transcriptional regulator n=1 Tax=unclassified Gilliamella TaxID=2685620 RepID=UPI002269B3CE|nr:MULTISPECIES: Rha family transcriptional regulator [unclassified Gilliamella]MCX8597651.1 Rha family transcriptional regulator [Gilliamella sp. B3493]MCX8599119.1 Rha family transcriptional regulator [Gilliamella sp. B3486]MCX8688871.1 Rha family transcriptional regulator [Gilliamella sp. B2973]MCX8704575.1 Rha family transcriptional regulator [Gilliamella sp. B3127]
MKNDTSLVNKSQLTMSSREIAELVGSRHDKVKQSIERLAKNKVITLPPLGIYENINNLGFKIKSEYYIFNGEQGKRDSIIVIAQLCPKYTARIVDRWQELEEAIARSTNKKATVSPKHIGLAEYRKARAISMATKSAEVICNRFDNLSKPSQQVIFAKMVNSSVNEELIPLPILENKTFSASEVGHLLDVSSNMIGRIANKLNLKTDEYGIFVLDKSRSSDKQVETFRYNEKAIDVIKNHLINKEIA